MIYKLKPLVGIFGEYEIHFGLSRMNVRASIDSKFLEMKRNDFADNTSDYYEQLGFFVEYSEADVCEALEFTNQVKLYYEGEDLFAFTFSSLKNRFNTLSQRMDEEGEISVTYYDLGFSISRSYKSDDIETVLVFSNSYW